MTDNRFWEGLKPYIVDILEEDQWSNPKQSANDIVRDATATDLFMYTELLDFEAPEMPDDMASGAKKFRNKNDSSVFCVPLKGTTFSGHPTRTTLGNTLRSLMYMYYYLECAGYPEPWNRTDCFVAASGDDTVLWCDNSMVDSSVESIRKL
jgi:hypothetical protein